MQPNSLSRPSFSVHLIIVTVALVVAIVFAACATDSNQNNTNVPKTVTTPSPSPSPSGSPRYLRVPGDTIIIIRDGSVRMKVNKEDRRCDDLPDDPDDRTKKNYGCNRVMLSEIGIYSIDDGPRFVELNENSRITIDGEGGDKDIKIHRNGQDVKITFKKERYPQCDSGVAGEHCGSNHVGKLLVDGAEIKNCDPEVKCEFWIRIKPRP